MSNTNIWTPPLPFAILAYDRNKVIGYGDHMAYLPRRDLLTDSENMWAVLTNPEQEVSLVGGRTTMLRILGVIPPTIHDVIVVTSHPDSLNVPNQRQSGRIRTAPDPITAMDMASASGKVPAIFGGASLYNNEIVRSRLWYVLATEIDAEFQNVTGEPVKTFQKLPASEWEVKSNEPMPRGEHDKFDARFVIYERVSAA